MLTGRLRVGTTRTPSKGLVTTTRRAERLSCRSAQTSRDTRPALSVSGPAMVRMG
jgi:hypothetical protein